MNPIIRTKNFLEFNFISTVFFYLLFTQFFINSTQLNIGIWQDESPYSFTTNASALERISNNLKNSFQEVAINTVASSASQSAINGDSFTDSLKAQGENILIYTLAKVGANEIGRAYHGTTVLDGNGNVIDKTPPTIGKSEQLLLHAGLGAITSSLTGNDAMSGAIAGVAGELTAELANENGADVATSIQLANLSGAISSVIYGGLTNQSDEEMANNAWEGSRIGGNAGANNLFFIPLVASVGTATLLAIGDGDTLKGAEKVNIVAEDLTAPITNTLVDGIDVVANWTGLTEDGATPLRDALNAAGNAYQTYIPEGSRQVLGLTGLTLGFGGAASIGKGFIYGTKSSFPVNMGYSWSNN